MLNGLISCNGQIFNQNPLFFVTQDCANPIKAFLLLKVLLGNNFPLFVKSPGKHISKTCQIETKLVCEKVFR